MSASPAKAQNKGQPSRLVLLDKPHIYGGVFLFSIAVYIDSLKQDSLINRAIESAAAFFLDLGERGFLPTLRAACSTDSLLCKLCVCALALALFGWVIVRVVHYINSGGQWGSSQIEDCSAAQRLRPLLTPRQFELQKMETTRIELEKLTGSEEFKRHQASKKKTARKGAASLSMIDGLDATSDNGSLPPKSKY